MTEAEKILTPALMRAADTFSDLAATLRLLGWPLVSEAARIAERDARFALEDAEKAGES